ncbi:hypothetical protein HAX54_022830 [Datura stramonium]|uniref:Uncharacterized protein n=1 Tax=Datura stramonium TaxID=4076 RepID=A0ABS8S4K9_DATST|nr:hypothetical protein [Datura stramonium]
MLNRANIRLQMANKSIEKSEGVVEDVFLKVKEFIIPTNFVISDCDVDIDIPIILRFDLKSGSKLNKSQNELQLHIDGRWNGPHIENANCYLHRESEARVASNATPSQGSASLSSEDQLIAQCRGQHISISSSETTIYDTTNVVSAVGLPPPSPELVQPDPCGKILCNVWSPPLGGQPRLDIASGTLGFCAPPEEPWLTLATRRSIITTWTMILWLYILQPLIH